VAAFPSSVSRATKKNDSRGAKSSTARPELIAARQLIDQVEEAGGAVAAIERGFQKAEIERSAYDVARQIESGERVIVGVNRLPGLTGST